MIFSHLNNMISYCGKYLQFDKVSCVTIQIYMYSQIKKHIFKYEGTLVLKPID